MYQTAHKFLDLRRFARAQCGVGAVQAGEFRVPSFAWSHEQARREEPSAMRARIVSTVVGCVLAIALLVPAGVNAQGISANSFQNWNFIGAGARARAMGGAYLGVSDDYSAATWNPAGLIFNEGVLLSWNYSSSHIGLGLDNTPLGTGHYATRDQSSSDNMGGLSSASFLAPLTLREHEFVLSAYYHRVQDVYARGEFHLDDADSTTIPIKLGTPFTTDFDLIGNIAYIGAGFGTSIATNLTFGGVLNIVTGDGGETHRMTLDQSRYADVNSTTSSIQRIEWTDKSDIDYSGLNFTLGTMYRTDRWTGGLVFSPSWTLTQNLDYVGRGVTIKKDIPSQSLGIVPGPDGTNREIRIPWSVGMGGSYRISENFMVAADYQFRAFKREGAFRYESDPVTPDSPLETQPDKFYNLHQLRLGAEYILETSWGIVPLRIGVRNDPLLIGDQSNVLSVYDQRAGFQGTDPKDAPRVRDLTPRDDYFLPLTYAGAEGSQINPITFTIGSGVHWSQIHLDFALEFMGYNYEETGDVRLIRLFTRCEDCSSNDPRLSTDDWGDRITDDVGQYKRTYEDNRVRLTLNFTGYF
jgi:opacity protein-like surface antigen